MSKRGSIFARKLTEKYWSGFNEENNDQKSSGNDNEIRTTRKQKEPKPVAKLDLKPEEMISTKYPLRKKKKRPTEIGVEFKGNKVRRPADDTLPDLIPPKTSLRRTTKKFKLDGLTNREEHEHSQTNFYKNKKDKRNRGVMINPNKIGPVNKRERKQAREEKAQPLFFEEEDNN